MTRKKSFRENIVKFNNAIKPYYAFLFMLAFLWGIIFTSYKLIARPPGLSVAINKEIINYPSKINNEIIDVYNHFKNSEDNKQIKASIFKLYNYLINTQDYWGITISNNSSKIIRDINIRILNVSDLTSWGVSSNYLLDKEKQKIIDNVSFNESSGIINLKNSVTLPPEASLCIHLWGAFDEFNFSENVFVIHDGGTGKIIKTAEVSGLEAFIANSAGEILFLLIFIFLIVYRAGIKQKK